MIRYRTTWIVLCQFVMCYCFLTPACRQPVEVREGYGQYYLSPDKLPSEGLTYTYRSLLDTTLREVWKHVPHGANSLESINYDNNKHVVQKQYESLTAEGVILDSLLLYYPEIGKMTEVPVKVIEARKYPFLEADSAKAWSTQMDWRQPGDSLRIVLTRSRMFYQDTMWEFNGKKIPAAVFKVDDKFETEAVGWTATDWAGREIYAKDLGLVYYLRQITDKMRVEFALEKVE